jgi:large subunit ribosomal protein L30
VKAINGDKVIVKQVRSTAGRAPQVRRTIEALGLGRIGKETSFVLNDAVRGMIARVAHLLEIRKAA